MESLFGSLPSAAPTSSELLTVAGLSLATGLFVWLVKLAIPYVRGSVVHLVVFLVAFGLATLANLTTKAGMPALDVFLLALTVSAGSVAGREVLDKLKGSVRNEEISP